MLLQIALIWTLKKSSCGALGGMLCTEFVHEVCPASLLVLVRENAESGGV